MSQMKKTGGAVRLAAAAAVLAVLILIPVLTPNSYVQQIINMIGIYVILGTGINILTGYTGLLSLGQAAFFGIGAYVTAILNTRTGAQFFVCLIVSILVTCAASLILAVPALKVKGPYLALLTQGFGEIIRIVMINWVPVTNGTNGIKNIASPVIFGFAFNDLTRYYFLIVLFAAAGLFYQRILMRSRTGRAFIAIREDNEAAELTGIHVTAYKIRSFVLSSVYCAVAGTLYAMMIRYVSPDSFIANTSSVILWTAIVGGFGTLVGPIIGGVVMQTLPELLRFCGQWRLVIYGVILLVVILRFPGGLYPYLQKLAAFVRSRLRKPASAGGKG